MPGPTACSRRGLPPFKQRRQRRRARPELHRACFGSRCTRMYRWALLYTCIRRVNTGTGTYNACTVRFCVLYRSFARFARPTPANSVNPQLVCISYALGIHSVFTLNAPAMHFNVQTTRAFVPNWSPYDTPTDVERGTAPVVAFTRAGDGHSGDLRGVDNDHYQKAADARRYGPQQCSQALGMQRLNPKVAS